MDKNELIEYIYGYDVPKDIHLSCTCHSCRKKEEILKDSRLGLATYKKYMMLYLKTESLYFTMGPSKKVKDLTSGSFDVKITNKVLTDMFHLYDVLFLKIRLTINVMGQMPMGNLLEIYDV